MIYTASMKLNPARYVVGLLLLGAVSPVAAQSTWNYFISDAGNGNSLVTWTATGTLTTSPGAVLTTSESSLSVSIVAPGIYTDAYAAGGTTQPIPAADGSYFQYDLSSVYAPVVLYYTANASGSGSDTFGLVAPLLPHTGAGMTMLYHPGTQSAIIPVDFSNFNPGTYQSQETDF